MKKKQLIKKNGWEKESEITDRNSECLWRWRRREEEREMKRGRRIWKLWCPWFEWKMRAQYK